MLKHIRRTKNKTRLPLIRFAGFNIYAIVLYLTIISIRIPICRAQASLQPTTGLRDTAKVLLFPRRRRLYNTNSGFRKSRSPKTEISIAPVKSVFTNLNDAFRDCNALNPAA